MRRVVITGIGLVTAVGNDRESTWKGLLEGRSGAGPNTRFDVSSYATKFACEVKDWDATPYMDKRQLRHLDLFLQYGVCAGLMAMDDAGYADRKVPEGEEERWGTYVGAGLGGVSTIESTHLKAHDKGPRHGFSPFFVTDIIINMIPGLLSIATGARGPNFSHVSACASGAHSIGEAMRAIRHGYADVMIAGGAESTVSVLGVGGFNAMRAMSTRNDDPQGASRPFDKDRDGFVMGEGCGLLVLEEYERAKARGARIYCELKGYGSTDDAFHITAPEETGDGPARAMEEALRHGKIPLDEVDYVNAHGTSTEYNDATETKAIRRVFGSHADSLAVSSTKSMIGHLLGAATGVELVYTVLAVHTDTVHPTRNYTTPDSACNLDYVPGSARSMRVRNALCNSLGFGGHNVSILVGKL